MRKNFPVTNDEYVLGNDTLIVSKTDTKGKLTYFNKSFVDAAGFEPSEMMGQPHNIVRHPDMPPVAFENLWNTIKAGKPWAGAIKNRRKNGGFYWVLASATPIFEAGQISGYMSIRSKLPMDQRDEAEHAYAEINAGRGKKYRLDAGMLRTRSLSDAFAPFTRTLKARLITLASVQAAAALIVGIAGYQAASQTGLTATIAVGTAIGVALVLGGLLTITTIRAISRPLAHANEVLAAIGQGRFDSRVIVERDDEIGIALRSILALQSKLGFDLESKRDMEATAVAQRRADMHKLAGDFESAIGDIIETVASASTQLEAAAGTLTHSAESTQQLSVDVASASEEASTNVQSVASATEELSSSIMEIGRQVQESARIARDAVAQANHTNERVSALSSAATQIGDVVELINNIAGQTNLLALNATIEAARAGEAGRGFAVVAAEVKALAEQTAKATGEIGRQIEGIQAATEESVHAIKEIGSTIERLSEISSTIAATVEEQGTATQEIARNVQQAAQGTQQVSSNITDVQRGASETGSASSQVLAAAQSLSGDSSRLKLEVGKFLGSVRAA
jgi:methyl-accepting chemotaxis protein/aerotaxis receptor